MTHLNWQNTSAYSDGISRACKIVTLKVNSLSIIKWSGNSSSLESELQDALLSPRPLSPSPSFSVKITSLIHEILYRLPKKQNIKPSCFSCCPSIMRSSKALGPTFLLLLTTGDRKSSSKTILADWRTPLELSMTSSPAGEFQVLVNWRNGGQRYVVFKLPDTACTATRRYPLTSPFSLTMAILWISGTGYNKLLRYTNDLRERMY